MEKVTGKRNDTAIFVYDGHVYHIDKRCNGIYRCASRRSLHCYAALVRNQDETYTLKTSHNHPSNETMLQEIELKQEMLQICRETIMKPKDIFDMVCRRNPVAAKKISYRAMRSFLYREQIRHRPETPQTIAELEVALMNYQPIERIYKGKYYPIMAIEQCYSQLIPY
ncbi:unnamed protein product [Lasius platythorax]|uniref:FLYWCH-type domain-containing protein n=1 Tax=Lasius platythorax TaxID=488582 RepID=A0AAV2MZR8_9HYME